ncbi:MAG TPA: amidohydrolase, partial [Burkholderiales bacterium]|nr:amidohydrolase [Burkholderiales bacterium]
SVIDAGGGFQNYPDDYAVIQKLSDDDQLTVRLAYNLFTQKPKEEKQDFLNWTSSVKYKQGNDYFRHNGAGEMLVFSAADFEDFRQPRPGMAPEMEGELEEVVRVLAENRWPWRLHATYDETISRALDVFEKVNRDVPLTGMHWFIDHAETITPRSMDRVKALGGGIAIQHRMAFQGEYFVSRYGAKAGEAAPPINEMLARHIPVGAGTDATRVASYNPWIALSWLTTGKTVGGLRLYPPERRLDRAEALRLWTQGSAWFSTEQDKKGTIAPGQFADLAVLSDDYFAVPEDRISRITAVMTIVDGKIVYGADSFRDLAPPLPPVSPDWAPVRHYGGYQHAAAPAPTQAARACHDGCAHHCAVHAHDHAGSWAARVPAANATAFWGALGCSCFF